MTTRRPAVWAAAAAAVVAIAAAAIHLRRTSAPAGPNVLILVLDTVRADRCSLLGYPRPTTPRLDAFAADAVTFTEAWTSSGWTGPSHAALFTGLGPERNGFDQPPRQFLAEAHTTIAERLRAAGWATGCFSDNNVVSAEFGLVQGFEHVEPLSDLTRRPYPWAPATHAAAFAWAQEQDAAGRPFLLFVNDMECHGPYTPDREIASRFLPRDASAAEVEAARAFAFPRNVAVMVGAERLPARTRSLLSDLYDAELAGLDAHVGAFLDRFREAGLLDRTLVVIVSDHGEHFGEHGLLDHVASLHRPIRHVPLVVRYPGRFDGGRRETDLVRIVDVVPTVLEVCGLPPPPGMDGLPLSRDLGGRITRAWYAPNDDYGRRVGKYVPGADMSPVTRGVAAVFDGHHHLIRWSDGREALYDLARDPGETDDILSRAPAAADRLRPLLLTGRVR